MYSDTRKALTTAMAIAMAVGTSGIANAGAGGDPADTDTIVSVGAATFTALTGDGAEIPGVKGSGTLIFGDWNGDGDTTVGLYRNLGGLGLWLLDVNGDGAFNAAGDGGAGVGALLFGSGTGTPVVGDWDPTRAGDEVGVAVASGGPIVWRLFDTRETNNVRFEVFGPGTATPVPGNWDGDAANGSEPGVTLGAGALLLWVTQGSGGIDFGILGRNGDTPVPGDYTGGGDTNRGVKLAEDSRDAGVFVLDEVCGLRFENVGADADTGVSAGNFGFTPL